MATVLTITALKAQVYGEHVRTAVIGDDEGATDQQSTRPFDLQFALAMANGVGDGQADLIFMDTHQVAGAATKQYDLAGVLKDPNGNLLTFATVKWIYLKSRLAANKVLSLTTPAANGFTTWQGAAQDIVKIQPGGAILLIAPNTGYAVVAGTGDLLDVVNAAGGTSDYDICIGGTSS